MNIKFSIKAFEVSDTFKNQMLKKLDKLSKILGSEARVEVAIEGTGGAISGDQGTIALRVVEPTNNWYTYEEGSNILDALDEAVNSMYHEITRGKTKHRDTERSKARKTKHQLHNR